MPNVLLTVFTRGCSHVALGSHVSETGSHDAADGAWRKLVQLQINNDGSPRPVGQAFQMWLATPHLYWCQSDCHPGVVRKILSSTSQLHTSTSQPVPPTPPTNTVVRLATEGGGGLLCRSYNCRSNTYTRANRSPSSTTHSSVQKLYVHQLALTANSGTRRPMWAYI